MYVNFVFCAKIYQLYLVASLLHLAPLPLHYRNCLQLSRWIDAEFLSILQYGPTRRLTVPQQRHHGPFVLFHECYSRHHGQEIQMSWP